MNGELYLLTLLIIGTSCSLDHSKGHQFILTEEQKQAVEFLVHNGYLTTNEPTKYEFRRSLRDFQREYKIPITGTISFETINLIYSITNRDIVIDYLRRHNYDVSPRNLKQSVTRFQNEAGVYSNSGEIDFFTIMFVKEHPNGFKRRDEREHSSTFIDHDGLTPI